MDKTSLSWFLQYEPAIITHNRHDYEVLYKTKYAFIKSTKKICWLILSFPYKGDIICNGSFLVFVFYY